MKSWACTRVPAAYSGEHDPLLANWEKTEQPFLAYPPPDMGLVGWRDPFIFEFKGQEGKQEWGMLLGSGIKGKGGAVMIYRSPSLHDGARCDGPPVHHRTMLQEIMQPMNCNAPACVPL